MAVVSIRIPDELKAKMKEVNINWSEEIRRFIEMKIREQEKRKLLDEIDAFLEKEVPPMKKGQAVKLVRDARDSN
ncbi:type II toxin-antitoxin system VapB family antitoxin [Thermococcus sp.]